MRRIIRNFIDLYQVICMILIPVFLISFSFMHQFGAFKNFYFEEQASAIDPTGNWRASIVYEGPLEEGRLIYYGSGLHIIPVGEEIGAFSRWFRGYGFRPPTEVARGRYFGPGERDASELLVWVTPKVLEFRYCNGSIREFRNFINVESRDGAEHQVEIRLRSKCN